MLLFDSDNSDLDNSDLGSLAPSTLWLEKQRYLLKLYQLSHASILDDQSTRDRFEQQMVSFIYGNDFDAINGGIILKSHNPLPPLTAKELQKQTNDKVINSADSTALKEEYCKPLALNILLTELLTCTDQVLYNGLFSITASRQMQFLFNCLFDHVPAPQNELSCYFSLDSLSLILDKNELALMTALIADSLASLRDVDDKEKNCLNINNNGLLVCYHRTLSDAADYINMPYKQAQIIEFQALQKLSRHLSNTHKSLNTDNALMITNYYADALKASSTDKTNLLCWLALILVRQLTIEPTTPLIKQLDAIMVELDHVKERLLNQAATDYQFEEQLHLLYTKLNEYQLPTSKVNFEQVLIDIEQLPSFFNYDKVTLNEQKLPQLRYQLLVLKRFLNASNQHFQYFSYRITNASDHIEKLTLIFDDYHHQLTSSASALSVDTATSIMEQLEPLVEVIFLPSQQAVLQQQRMKLQSKFNPFQYIFDVE